VKSGSTTFSPVVQSNRNTCFAICGDDDAVKLFAATEIAARVVDSQSDQNVFSNECARKLLIEGQGVVT
jgi:hypothetical protein